MKKLILLFLLSTIYQSIHSQSTVQLSVYSEVSIITAGAGDELFEAFGHSAIRIKDPLLRLDVVYNYGMFDFNAPNFYTNFTKGKLLYKLGRYPFQYFLNSYQKDKRWVKQQVLNLSQQEKQSFFLYLENNALAENATYLYDPFYNNCASKLKDITLAILGDKVQFKPGKSQQNLSFRDLMNAKIHWNTWGNFGINLALGSKLDQIANLNETMYMPEYVYEIFKASTLTKNSTIEPLVKSEVSLIDYPNKVPKISILNPVLVFTIFCLIGLWITYKDFHQQKRTKWFDFTLFFITGIIGVLLVFLWFFTDHSTTPNNYNILWAFCVNLLFAFLLLNTKPKVWIKKYLSFLLLLLLCIPIIWILKLQIFPYAAIPIMILLLVRYTYLIKHLS